jgi:hypothetical protein
VLAILAILMPSGPSDACGRTKLRLRVTSSRFTVMLPAWAGSRTTTFSDGTTNGTSDGPWRTEISPRTVIPGLE